jgi:hypothetical protein
MKSAAGKARFCGCGSPRLAARRIWTLLAAHGLDRQPFQD